MHFWNAMELKQITNLIYLQILEIILVILVKLTINGINILIQAV